MVLPRPPECRTFLADERHIANAIRYASACALPPAWGKGDAVAAVWARHAMQNWHYSDSEGTR